MVFDIFNLKFMSIIGHKKQLDILDRSVKKNKVSQAYLFFGSENVGKFTIALDFAKKITEHDRGLNQNLYILKPEIDPARNATHSVAGGGKKLGDIKIKQIKDLQHWLSLSSSQEKKRVAIIDDAQKLNKTSQNALLKTLEDARENTVVILVSQDEEKILPTIISRSHKLKFGLVSNQDLRDSVQNEIDKDVIFWSMGKPGLFRKLSESSEELEFRREVLSEFSNIFSQNVSERIALAETMSENLEISIKKFNLWLVIIRESILNDNFNRGFTNRIELVDRIEKSLNLLSSTNANVKITIENLLINF